MMTEDEARTKWCPHARLLTASERDRVEPGLPVGYNRHPSTVGVIFGAARCLASDCMAWRWSVTPIEAERANADERNSVKAVATGFCGMAGR